MFLLSLKISKSILGLLILASYSTLTFGQSEIKKEIAAILHNSSKSYEEITHEVDSIFDTQDLGYASINLDGPREKYERWKSFWGKHLDETGHLVDYTQYLNSTAIPNEKAIEWCDGVEIDAEWTNLNYNQNMGYQIDLGRTTCMGFSPSDPNTFYVGSGWGGIWKTTDAGVSYTNVNDRLPLAAVSGIYIDPGDENHLLVALGDHVWYGTNSIGIYESWDAGVSFLPTSVNFPLTDDKWIYELTSYPGNPNVLFAATDFGLIRSDDFFATYNVLEFGSYFDIQFSQANPMVGYASSNGSSFLKTVDGGNTFSFVIDFGAGPAQIDVDDTNPDRVVVTSGDQIYYSTDGAATFLQSTMPESNCVVDFIPGTSDGILIGNFEAYRSDNGGASFYPVTHWLGNGGLDVIHVDHRNSYTNPHFPDRVYLCNDGGIFRYNHTSNNFTNLSKDLIITQYYDIAVSDVDPSVIGGGSQDNGNVTRNSNGAWSAYAGTGDGMQQAIHLSNPNIRFWEYQYGGMRRYNALTQNNVDIKPTAQTDDGDWHTPYILDPNNHNRIICGYQRVYESFDLGDSWNYLGSSFANGNLHQLAIAPSNSDFLYASRNERLWKKTDVLDWISLTTPPNLQTIAEIVVDNENPDIVYICSTGFTDGMKVWKSIDGGNTWVNISYDLPNFPAFSMRLIDDQLGTSESGLFLGTIGSVFYLPEGGTEWFKYGCLPATQISDIEIQYSTNKIFIGTHGRGIFETTMDNFELLSTDEITLETQIEVHPNPSSGMVFVDSELNFTSLVIYDQSLRKMNVIEGLKLNKGIDIKHLNSGVYFFRFEAEDGEVITKRVVKE